MFRRIFPEVVYSKHLTFPGTFCAGDRNKSGEENLMSHRTIFLAAAVLMFAAIVFAHHNMSVIYDFNDKIMMSGTLTKID